MEEGIPSILGRTLLEALAFCLLVMPSAASAQEAVRLELGLGPAAKSVVVRLPSGDLDLDEPPPLPASARGIPVEDPPLERQKARQLIPGEVRAGDVTRQEEQVFWFEAEAGKSYRITVDLLMGIRDAGLKLYDAQGNPLAENNDPPEENAPPGHKGRRGPEIEWTFGQKGVYYARVEGFPRTYRGLFHIGLRETDIRRLVTGQEAGGEIRTLRDRNPYFVEAEQGVRYRIGASLGTLLDSVLELYDSDGNLVAENDDAPEGSGLGRGSQIEWTCPRSGTYRIVVRGFAGVKGTYTVRLEGQAFRHGRREEGP